MRAFFRQLLALTALLLLGLAVVAQAPQPAQATEPLTGEEFCARIQLSMKPGFECDPVLRHPVCVSGWVFEDGQGRCRPKNLLDKALESVFGQPPSLLAIQAREVYFVGQWVNASVRTFDRVPVQGAKVTVYLPNQESRVLDSNAGMVKFPVTLRGDYAVEARSGDAVASARFRSYGSLFGIPLLHGDWFLVYNYAMEDYSGFTLLILLVLAILAALLQNANANVYFSGSPWRGPMKGIALLFFLTPLATLAFWKLGAALLVALAELAFVFFYFNALASAKGPAQKPQ